MSQALNPVSTHTPVLTNAAPSAQPASPSLNRDESSKRYEFWVKDVSATFPDYIHFLKEKGYISKSTTTLSLEELRKADFKYADQNPIKYSELDATPLMGTHIIKESGGGFRKKIFPFYSTESL